ncbi:hypothetical protein HMI54_005273 [Coelomomyces lativittatus]|nr:hypothetical protein HMI56_001108 [Coelomomyces lativittatus]KAJ1506192.1 hypothetical protein HMI54_005273 [Coelomomyces lativittatus]KAJ1509041.1 hypothetical protein HMI55_000120 [Coelomomyces lativittatus]
MHPISLCTVLICLISLAMGELQNLFKGFEHLEPITDSLASSPNQYYGIVQLSPIVKENCRMACGKRAWVSCVPPVTTLQGYGTLFFYDGYAMKFINYNDGFQYVNLTNSGFCFCQSPDIKLRLVQPKLALPDVLNAVAEFETEIAEFFSSFSETCSNTIVKKDIKEQFISTGKNFLQSEENNSKKIKLAISESVISKKIYAISQVIANFKAKPQKYYESALEPCASVVKGRVAIKETKDQKDFEQLQLLVNNFDYLTKVSNFKKLLHKLNHYATLYKAGRFNFMYHHRCTFPIEVNIPEDTDAITNTTQSSQSVNSTISSFAMHGATLPSTLTTLGFASFMTAMFLN